MTQTLFSPLTLGKLNLKNRIFMAPLTRCRADAEHTPTAMMATYYQQRASAGMIIAEATMAMPGNSAFWREPGIYSDSQVIAWKKVTDAVHAKDGKIALQIWHGGRACHSLLNNGSQPVSASALKIQNDFVHTPQGKQEYETPRALELSELPIIIAGFKKAAINAKAAGFDAVEIHAANGYLIDQFLRDGSNKRQDNYGGSLENRSRLLLEITDAVTSVWGPDSIGVRISPLNSYNDMLDSKPLALTEYVASALDKKRIAFLHIMRGDFLGKQNGDVLTVARKHFKNCLIANAGISPSEADSMIKSSLADAIAFGHHYISNPDLVERVKANIPLVEPDSKTFYTQGENGYIDYPVAETLI